MPELGRVRRAWEAQARRRRKKKRRVKTLIYRCRLSWTRQNALLALFSAGATARAAARAVGVNRMTAQRIFRVFRERIALSRAAVSPFVGRAEVDECYLSGGRGGRRVSKQGRSLSGKFAVVGVAQREKMSGLRRLRLQVVGRVDCPTLTAFVVDNVRRGAQVHTDQLPAYKLGLVGFDHRQVNHHREYKCAATGACTNLIENAWSVLKRHLGRFCGGWRHNLILFLREIEMRWECGVASFGAALRELLLDSLRPPEKLRI